MSREMRGRVPFSVGGGTAALHSGIATLGSVAEPPKLYGLHALVIVPKTSDGYARVPDNLKSLSVSLGNSNPPHFIIHIGSTKQ
jgi:hypothetical protein